MSVEPSRIDSAIAQEWPIAAHVFEFGEIHFTNQNIFAIVAGFRDYDAEGVAYKRRPPELKPGARC